MSYNIFTLTLNSFSGSGIITMGLLVTLSFIN